MKEGDLVKWYELYGDVYIVKATGLGIILSEAFLDHFGKISYKVHNIENGLAIIVEEHCLEKI